MDKKTIAIIVLAILVVILGWIAYKPEIDTTEGELTKRLLERLNNENKALLDSISSRDKQIAKNGAKIDSLQSLKPKIKKIYVEKYKQIDNASSVVVFNEFDSLFTKINIK